MNRAFPREYTSSVARLNVWGLLGAAGFLVSCASVVGFMGQVWWVFDLFSHFRVQYTLALIAFTVLFLIGRRWMATSLVTLMLASNLALIVPLYLEPSRPRPPSSQTFRAMSLNVHTENTEYNRAVQTIRAFHPDVLVLIETDYLWLSALKELEGAYPYSITHPRDDNFGIALYSRWPIRESRMVATGTVDVPSILAEVLLDGHPMTILATHPLPPVGADYARLRNEQLADIPQFVTGRTMPTLLLGDLNITPWSPFFKTLLDETGLADCTTGFGVQPTWPTFQPALLIPIDHCLHSPDISILKKRIGPGVGSDHYPVMVEFSLLSF